MKITYSQLKNSLPEIARIDTYLASFSRYGEKVNHLVERLNHINQQYTLIKNLNVTQIETNSTEITLGANYNISIPIGKRNITDMSGVFLDNSERITRTTFSEWLDLLDFYYKENKKNVISLSELSNYALKLTLVTLDSSAKKKKSEEFTIIPKKIDLMVDTTSLQRDEIPMDFYVIGYRRQ